MKEQMLLLVDKNDRFLGKYAPKSRCHTGKGLHHRAFTIIIQNKSGEILLQKRKHQLWDGFWDLTNSHPLHKKDGRNETYEEAAKRCLKREWGIEISLKKLFGFNYFSQEQNFCENEYCLVLLGQYDGKLSPNSQLAYAYKWKSLTKLLKEIKVYSSQYTPWLIQAIEKLTQKTRLSGG